MLLEGIRYWEDDEERKIKEEFDSNDDEFVTNDNSITSDAEPTPCEISNIISNLQFSVGNVKLDRYMFLHIYFLDQSFFRNNGEKRDTNSFT